MTKKLSSFFEWVIFALFLTLILILTFGKGYNYAFNNGLALWFTCVLPSLFPYIFITAILNSLSITRKIAKTFSPLTSALFKTNGNIALAYFISILSGYPMGAQMVSNLKQNSLISQTESVRGSALCSTSSPVFLIGTVGNIMFRNTLFGFLLFITHLVSSIIIGLLFSLYNKKEKASKITLTFTSIKKESLLYTSTYQAVISVLVVGGLITIFYIFTEVLISLNILTPLIDLLDLLIKDKSLSTAIVLSLFECTRGLKELSISKFSFLTLPICAFICGFGGLSIICQSVAELKKGKIKIAPFILSKIMGAIINFCLGLILSLIVF